MTPPDQEIPTPRTDAELFPAACCIPSMYPVVKREFCQMLEREISALQQQLHEKMVEYDKCWDEASQLKSRAEKAEKLYDNASAMFHEMQNKYYTLREDVKPLLAILKGDTEVLPTFLSKHPELQ